MEQLFDLKLFRKINNLMQKDLADFLDTSRAFLSLCESGKSKLPDSKIDRLLDDGPSQGWDIESLNPAYYRLKEAASFRYVEKGNFENQVFFDSITGHNIFDLPKAVFFDIKYGRKGIDPEIANRIVEKAPMLNVQWLISGGGDMFHTIEMPSDDSTLTEYERIIQRLDIFCDKLEQIEYRIKNIETALGRMSAK